MLLIDDYRFVRMINTMKTVRRQFPVVQTRKMEEAYRQIFRGLYYRHEFARRNKTVFEAGAGLPKMLGLPEERFRTFIQSNRCLTDDIIKAVEGKSGRAKGVCRSELRAYLKTHKIVPMTWDWSEKRPFFPRELFTHTQSWFHHCYTIFNALMRFEAYALAKWGLGEPVMFPLAFLRVGSDAERDSDPELICALDLKRYAAPMFLDFTAPKNAFDAYCDAFAHQLNTQPSRICPNGIGKINEDQFDQHLEVYDVARPWISGRRDNAVLGLYAAKTKIDKNTLSLKADWKKMSFWFSQKLKLAKPFVDKYQEFI